MNEEKKKENNALPLIGLAALAGVAVVLLGFKKAEATPCTEGTTKCVGTDLYSCVGGTWQMTEHNSTTCGYTPPLPYCCPYGDNECFATYEELVAHVQTIHPGERIPIDIFWE